MSDPNQDRKKKQLIIAAVGGTVLIGGTLTALFLMDDVNQQPVAAPTQAVDFTTPGAPGTVDDRDAWRTQQAAQEQSNQEQINQLTTMLQEQAKNNQTLSEQLTSVQQQVADVDRRSANMSTPVFNAPPPLAPQQTTQSKTGIMGQQILPNPLAKSGGDALSIANNLDQVNKAAQPQIEIIDFKDESSSVKNENAASAVNKAGQTDAEEPKDFLPATTFVRALLLNGVDAPTGGQAQGNPLPITLQVVDTANLPNKYKANLKGCRFLGAAWGDLSSERMMARVENMSCVINGKAVVLPIRGYVIGEDGKTGVRGRLVSKQGQALANSLLAGVASSTANVFATASSPQSVSTNALGGTTTTSVMNKDDLKNAAIGGGLSSAAQNLAQYYIQQAEKMYPVIETDAGRIVEILITDGVAFPKSSGINRQTPTNLALGKKRVLSND